MAIDTPPEAVGARLAGRGAASLIRAYDRLAVALAQAQGAAAGLAALQADGVLTAQLMMYLPYWAARGELLLRLGRRAAAAEAYLRAIGLEDDPAVRAFLQTRLALVA